MSTLDEREFRRLLRWYPRAWRELNGDVFIATLLEAANGEGRSGPTPAEHRSAFLHGISAHINRRLAISLSLAASVLSAALSVSTMFGTVGGGIPAAVGYPLLSTFAIPVLTATALIATFRDRGWVSDARALSMLVISAVALALAALASVSWGLGFDAADTAVAPPPLAHWWGALTVAGIVAGTIALALLADSLLQRTSSAPLLRNAASVAIAVVTAPVLGLALLAPTLAALVAMTTLIMSLMPTRGGGDPAEERNHVPRPSRRVVTGVTDSRSTLLVRGCGIVSAVAGTLGVAFAFTGSLWIPRNIDATQAMQYGIAILLVSALPLLVGFGTRVHLDNRVPYRHIWGPVTLAGVSLLVLTVGYLEGPEWEQVAPWFISGSLIAGVTVGWWVTPRTHLPRTAALLVGSSAGLVYAAVGGFMVTPVLAFTVPIWALILVTRTRTTAQSVRAVER